MCNNCHIEREHHAKGLCKVCYDFYRNQERTEYFREYSRKRAVERQNIYRNTRKSSDMVTWRLKERNNNLKRYGITIDDYDRLLELQNGQCAICGKQHKTTLHVDHNHTTGKVRGLLCPACNYLVAVVENITLLLKIQDYIAKHNE